MATNTPYLNLVKPAYSDTADIGDINDNMDKIDTAYNATKNKLDIKSNQAWNVWPSEAGTRVFFYESTTAATEYDVPYNYCFVVVHWYSNVRAVAYAIQWNSSSTGNVWVNNLHQTWQGWRPISGTTTVTPTVSSKDSRCGTVSTTCRRVGNVVFLYVTANCDFSGTHWQVGTNMEIKLEGLPAPANVVHSASYLGSNLFGTTLQLDGTVRYRNTAAELSNNSASLVTSFTYITNN